MAVMVGSAAVAITPDFRGFLAKASAGLKSELSSLDASIPVRATLDPSSLAKIKDELGLLAGADVPLKFTVDPASVAKARAALGVLAAGKAIPLRFDVDPASVAKARAALGALAGETVPVKFAVDEASAAKVRTALGPVAGDTIPVRFTVDSEGVASEIAAIRSFSQAEYDLAASMAVEAEAAQGAADAASDVAMRQALSAVEARLAQQAQDQFARTLIVSSAAGDLNAAAMRQATRINAAYGATTNAATASGRRFGGWLGGSVPLFGSATHSVGVWHIALDAALEGLIAVGTSVAVLSATLYAFAPAATDVYDHLEAVDSANDALGSSIPPLTKKFVALQKSMGPAVLELYGGGLNLVNRSAGLLSPTIHSVASLMEGWVASIDIWAGSQSAMGGLLKSGVGFLSQFGTAIGDVALAVVNLVSKEPGIVHFLLDVVEGAGKLLLWFSELPKPIVATVLALHGIYLWGGLAVTAITRLASGLGLTTLAMKLGLVGGAAAGAAKEAEVAKTTFLGLSEGPWIAILALAAGIAYVGYESTQASPQVAKFIGGINAGLAGMTASKAVLGGFATAIGQVSHEIQSQNLGAVLKGWGSSIGAVPTELGADMRGELDSIGSIFTAKTFGGFFGDIGKSIKGALDWKSVGAPVQLQNNLNALNAEINTVLGSGKNMDAEIGSLMRGTTTWSYVTGQGTGKIRQLGSGLVGTTRGAYTFSQSLALLNLAGVKSSDSLAVMRQKVDNLIEGYKKMGVSGGILANAVNAVTLAEEEQQSKASNLTAAYTTFIGLVTGSESAFVTFAQGIGTLSKDAAAGKTSVQGIAQANSSLASAQGRVASAQSSLSGLQKLGKATADTLSAAHDRLTAAEDSLTAAQGKASTASKTQAVSVNGLTAASLTLRSTWNGSITDAVSLYNAMLLQTQAAGMGSKGYGLLTQAGKDMAATMLPMAKNSKAATAELYALAQVAGYQGPDSFKALAAWVGKVHDPMVSLDKIESRLTIASADLATDTKNLAAAISQNLNTAMTQAIFIASGGQQAYTSFAESVIHAHGDIAAMVPTAQKLATELITQTHSVSDARKEFDVFAHQLGLTKQPSDNLWDSLKTGAPAAVAKAKSVITQMGTAFKDVGKDAGSAGASFSGVNFQSDVLDSSLSKGLLPSLQKVVTNMANGGTPVHALAQVIATELNPAVKDGALKNDTLRTAIYNMATEAGYAGEDKIKPLSTWLQTNATSLGTAMAAAQKYGDAIARDGQQSDAAQAARKRLIDDLIATGKYAGDSTTQIATMIAKVLGIPAKRALEIVMTGDGSYKISGGGFPTASGKAQTGIGGAQLAAGARVPGYGGGDIVPAMLEPGETVVPKHLTPYVAPLMKAHGVPGFAAGGLVDQGNAAVLSGQYAVSMSNQFAADMASSMVTAMKTAVTAAAAASALAFPSAAAAGTGSAQTIAKRLLASMGWAAQWPALDYLWTRESGWRWDADNPSSGAYGIPQSLPGDKMASAGADWRTDPTTQIRWGLGYIKSVYGDPDNAAAHEQSHGWYDQGINGPWLPPGLSLAANMTGGPEAIVRPDQLVKLAQSGDGGTTNYNANITRANPSDIVAAFQTMEMRAATKQRFGRPQ